MRLTQLTVDAFQSIRHAAVDFGAGLNILYGPNDLGKSTLATAIRAALLIPPSSTEAGTYGSWFSSDNPRVELTLVDKDGHYWRVRKTFGTSSSSAAELLHSKDALTFTQDSRARQVEDKLRTMLGWGIPAPGGKGGPRGVPTSFLANVLLATQADVNAILQQSLADDLDDSGKLRLTKALSTLAQDPLFKEVLGIAQREVDLYFTEGGRRRRGQSSRFREVGDQVKALKTELEDRRRQLEVSSRIEEDVNALREARALALVRVDEANAALAVVERRFRNTAARTDLSGRLANAQAALAAIDEQYRRLDALTAELDALQERIRLQEREVAAAAATCDVAQEAVRAAEDAHRIATSEDSAREQELRRALLAERGSDLTAKLIARAGHLADLDAAIQARDAASRAQGAVGSAKAALELAIGHRAAARGDYQVVAQERDASRAIVAFIRWRAALGAVEEASRAGEATASAVKEADQKDVEAAALESQCSETEQKLLKAAAILPTPDQVSAMLQLERELEKAEAALGGGVSVVVRPTAPVTIRAAIDQQALLETELSANRTFEAERTVRLAIADLVEVDITAGGADRRQAVEELRLRWQEEAVPLLKKAGAQNRIEIEALAAAMAREQEAAAELKRMADRLRTEAKELRARAQIHEARAASGAAALAEVEARKTALGDHDVRTLEEHYLRLGQPSEATAERLHHELAKKHGKLQDELGAREQASMIAEYRLAEAHRSATELDAVWATKAAAFRSADLDSLRAQTVEEIAALEMEQAANAAQIELLAADANDEVEKARSAVLDAREAHRIASQDRDLVGAGLEASRADSNARSGVLRELQTQIDRMDRSAAEQLVGKLEAELAALPIEPAASMADVESARAGIVAANREHDRAKEELLLKEGALSRVGGAALREEVERLDEALGAAETREREAEVDADAWMLLRNTLREVENDEGAHLGRALAGPVTARFEELTAGRYRGLRLDSGLKADALEAKTSGATGDEVLEALSVGTRGQLAALIRLTIADQLRSTIVLDDHLVHTDPGRLLWFRNALQRTAINAQIIVITCRPEDYLTEDELPVDTASRDIAAGTIRAIDVRRVLTRYEP